MGKRSMLNYECFELWWAKRETQRHHKANLGQEIMVTVAGAIAPGIVAYVVRDSFKDALLIGLLTGVASIVLYFAIVFAWKWLIAPSSIYRQEQEKRRRVIAWLKRTKTAHRKELDALTLDYDNRLAAALGEGHSEFYWGIRSVVAYLIRQRQEGDIVEEGHALEVLRDLAEKGTLKVRALKEGTRQPHTIDKAVFSEYSFYVLHDGGDGIGEKEDRHEGVNNIITLQYRSARFKESQVRALFPPASPEEILERSRALIQAWRQMVQDAKKWRKTAAQYKTEKMYWRHIITRPQYRRYLPFTDSLVRGYDPDDNVFAGIMWIDWIELDIDEKARLWGVDTPDPDDPLVISESAPET